ncbi:MAG: hypothetical protein ACXAC7_18375 [Candidatus Hodarchaeales archaeon]|jgi:hypothetical protein
MITKVQILFCRFLLGLAFLLFLVAFILNFSPIQYDLVDFFFTQALAMIGSNILIFLRSYYLKITDITEKSLKELTFASWMITLSILIILFLRLSRILSNKASDSSYSLPELSNALILLNLGITMLTITILLHYKRKELFSNQ